MSVDEKREGRGASAPRPSRRLTADRFVAGFVVKLVLLAFFDGIALVALPRMASHRAWNAFAATVLTTIVVNAVYLSRRRIPAKYMIPGTVFLLLFQVYPIGYMGYIAFTNYGTGNVLSKGQAIQKIVEQSREITDDAPRYAMAVLQNPAGELQLLLEDDNGKRYLASPKLGFVPLPTTGVTETAGVVTKVGDFRRLTLSEASHLGDRILKFVVKSKDAEIRPESLTTAAIGIQRYRYDARSRAIVDTVDGTRFLAHDGTFTSADGRILRPGYRAVVGWRNFTRTFTDRQVRDPFVRIFLWNFAFAIGSVASTFALGMFLAVTLNHPRLRGKRIYRSTLVIPYALPAVMSILIWSQGILNTKYGILNRAFGLNIDWLNDPWLARLSILVVNLWLGFPYMFLLCTGQLQSIPTELKEAATVDGANPRQAFRRVVFPLMLSGVAPLLISSFAFNFNNFNVIYLMTQGGPPIPGAKTIAGQTDILISYTYNLAFQSGRGGDYGFASAMAIIIFLLVASMAMLSFRYTKQFEEIQ